MPDSKTKLLIIEIDDAFRRHLAERLRAENLKPFGTLYTLLSPRKNILYSVALLVVVLGALAMAHRDIHEDIQFIIPDRDAAVGEEFSLLQDSPFPKNW